MSAFLCADLHLGHRGIHNYRKITVEDKNNVVLPKGGNFQYATRVIDSPEEHDDYIEKCWMEMKFKTRRDTIYLLGDVAFDDAAWERLDSWPGRKIIILGNHCTERTTIQKIAGLQTVNSVHSMLKYKSFWLTHAPMHPDELRGRRNVHGHMHYGFIRDRRYKCVSLEHTDWRPVNLEEIEREFERRQSLNYVRKTLGWKALACAILNGTKNIERNSTNS